MAEVTRNIGKASKALKEGKTVAFPTDTVFGLGTNAFNEKAVLKIFKIKKRGIKKPLIINISNIKMIKDITMIDKSIYKMLKAFWPGKVTFILNKKKKVLKNVSGSTNTLAVRIPDCKLTLELIKKAKCPIVSTSANIEGEKEPLRSYEIDPNLAKEIDIILNRDDIKLSGVPSTIVSLTDAMPRIIRYGEDKIVRKLIKYMIKFSYRIK
jgi:L-threonylcarbamoyladenylate synthase